MFVQLLMAFALPFVPHSSAAPDPSAIADSIVARYYTAIGGREKLLADSTLRMSGTYQEGSFNAIGTMLWRRNPNARRVSVTASDGFAYVEIFDGSNVWEYSEMFHKPAQLDTGAAERAGRRGAEFDESFVEYRTKGHRIQSAGRQKLDGRDADRIVVALSDGWVKEYYFDPSTGLMIALRKAMPLHARGEDIESLSYYSDYRKVGNVLRPFSIDERNVRTGKLMNSVRWTSIQANAPILEAAFIPAIGM